MTDALFLPVDLPLFRLHSFFVSLSLSLCVSLFPALSPYPSALTLFGLDTLQTTLCAPEYVPGDGRGPPHEQAASLSC